MAICGEEIMMSGHSISHKYLDGRGICCSPKIYCLLLLQIFFSSIAAMAYCVRPVYRMPMPYPRNVCALSAERLCTVHGTFVVCLCCVCGKSDYYMQPTQAAICGPCEFFVTYLRPLAQRHPMILDTNCSQRGRLLKMPILLANPRHRDRKSPSNTQLNCINKHCTSLKKHWTRLIQTQITARKQALNLAQGRKASPSANMYLQKRRKAS